MKILVTGGAGYIGSHVVNALLATEYEIVVLDNLQKGHRYAVLGGKLIEADLADRQRLEQVFQEHNIAGVIHLAADSLVGESMEDPAKYYYNNVLNGYNLLEVMRQFGTRYFVFSSTAAVYGNPEMVPIVEDHPTRPTNVYGRTKLHFEEMLADYEKAYGMKYVSLRYFNAAGADKLGRIGEDHQPETHLIPIILQYVLSQRSELKIFGTDYDTPDGTCIRDYIHVNDLSEAHILAIEWLFDGGDSRIYNLGNGAGYSVREVIKTAGKIINSEIQAIETTRRPGDPAILVASSERIKKELGWTPKYPELEKIIQSAWKWHQEHPEGFKK